MTANGLIVAFVVAVWAAYFVPLVLRRYDEASSSHSLETLSGLSRVIRRHSPEDGTDDDTAESVADPQASGASVSSAASRSDAPVAASPSSVVRPTRASARLAAQRRRRTLVSLVVLLVATGILVGFGVAPRVWLVVPAALIVAWLVACRVQVRREYGIGSAARPVEDSGDVAPAPRHADDEETIVVSGQIEDVDPGRKHVMEISALPAGALDEQLAIAVPSATTSGEAVWDPLPVTVPTYVTKPRVGRTVRTIDFSGPGAWTSGHVEGEATELPATATQRPAAEPDRRASGE